MILCLERYRLTTSEISTCSVTTNCGLRGAIFFHKTPFKLNMSKFSCSKENWGQLLVCHCILWRLLKEFFSFQFWSMLIDGIKAPYEIKLYPPAFPSDFLPSPTPRALPANGNRAPAITIPTDWSVLLYLKRGWQEEVVKFCWVHDHPPFVLGVLRL